VNLLSMPVGALSNLALKNGTDFSQAWLDLTPRQYAHATSQVLRTLYTQLGVEIKHVIATSDETDPTWMSVPPPLLLSLTVTGKS